jgi:hypothetical protein
MDTRRGRPRQQWFMEMVEVADALAKHAPVTADTPSPVAGFKPAPV